MVVEESDFELSQNSLKNLQGINEDIIEIVKIAIKRSKVDFGVSEGLRTLERQKKLLEEKKTQTLKSKHLDGLAVDVFAYVDGEAKWDWEYYTPIVDAFKIALEEYNEKTGKSVDLRWGGCWKRVSLIRDPFRDVEKYVAFKRNRGESPFIDAPHFEKVK